MNFKVNQKENIKDCHTMKEISYCFTKILISTPNLL